MAIASIVLSPLNAVVAVNGSVSIVATLTGDDVGVTQEYSWYVNDNIQTETGSTFEFSSDVDGISNINCICSIKDESDEIVETIGAKTEILVYDGESPPEYDLSFVPVIVGPPSKITYGDEFTLHVSTDGPSPDIELEYLWSTGETTKSIDVKATEHGNIEYTCSITASKFGSTKTEEASFSAVVGLANFPENANITVQASKYTAKVGDSISFTGLPKNFPDNTIFDYSWTNGSTGKIVQIDEIPSDSRNINIACTLTASLKGYNGTTMASPYAHVLVYEDTPPELTLSIDGPDSVFVDESFDVSVVSDGDVPSDIKYKWSISNNYGENILDGDTVSFTPSLVGGATIQVSGAYTIDGVAGNVISPIKYITVSSPDSGVEPPKASIVLLSNPYIAAGSKVIAECEIDGADPNLTYSYAWNLGNTDSNLLDYTVRSDDKATKTLVCNVTAYDGSRSVHKFVSDPVSLHFVAPMPAMVLIDGPTSATVGKEFTLDSRVKGIPTNTTVDYSWSNEFNTKAISVIPTVPGDSVYTVSATAKSPGWPDWTGSKSITVSVVAPEKDDFLIRYIHPLDWRESSFIWCGYWVIDEIQDAVSKGIDWKDPNSGLKYTIDLMTIATMLEDYPNVEIMESRNGRILRKSDFDVGIFY